MFRTKRSSASQPPPRFDGYELTVTDTSLGARNLARKHQQRAIRVIALAVEIPGGFRVEDANFR
jgi:hypothetical protein